MTTSTFPPIQYSPKLNNALLNTATREKAFLVAGNLSWYGALWADAGAVWYYQGNAQTWNTLNLSNSAGNLLSTMAIGESITLVGLFTQGSSGFSLPSQYYVDSVAVTVKWAGGSAPTPNPLAIDALSFTIIKTGTSTSAVFGSATKFA